MSSFNRRVQPPPSMSSTTQDTTDTERLSDPIVLPPLEDTPDIPALDAVTPLLATDLTVVSRAGDNKQATMADVWIQASSFDGTFVQSDGGHATGYAGTGSNLSAGVGSFAQGYASSNGEIKANYNGAMAQGYSFDGGTLDAAWHGGFAHGYSYGSGSTILASSAGSTATGFAYSVAPGSVTEIKAGTNGGSFAGGSARSDYGHAARVRSLGVGSFAHGYAGAYSGDGTLSATGTGSAAFGVATDGGQVTASQPGSFAAGRASGVGSVLSSASSGAFAQGWASVGGNIISYNYGAFAAGWARDSGAISATGAGSFALGYANDIGGIISSGSGCFAMGHTYSTGGYTSTITSSGNGSMAGGYTYAYLSATTITASGPGAFAWGRGYNGTISATGSGAFAFGDCTLGDIVASAGNAVQFGVGTNSIANSLRVGQGIRLFGATNGSPANGDIWLDGSVVKIRSNGITVSI